MIPAETEVGIIGTGSYLPVRVVGNAEVAASAGVPDGWVEERTGIRERRWAAAGQATSDLAIAAATSALAAAGLVGADIDMIVTATSTPDEPLPGVACRVQAAVGAHDAAAFDVDAVCTGFLYALETGRALLVANPAVRRVLVIGADIYSRIIDPADRRTFPLFGDGAGAVVLGRVPAGAGVAPVVLGSDGRLAHYVRVPAGGSRLPLTPDRLAGGQQYFKMLGRDVRLLVEQMFPKLVGELCARGGVAPAEIDHVVCHQANVKLIRYCAGQVGITDDQLVITGDRFGNTAAASLPIGLDAVARSATARPGDTCLLLSFGGGMSWGGTLLRLPLVGDVWSADRDRTGELTCA